MNIEIDSEDIILEKPIKQIGKYDIKIEIGKLAGTLGIEIQN